MACTNCGRAKVVLRGLCRPCYGLLRRTGSLAVTPKKKGRDQCTFEGCAEKQVARGLCEAHYRIAKRYGDAISPFGYGERRKHPNYETWRYQARVQEGRVPEWSDFWQFVADVGDRPSEQHKGRRLDERQPWGPSNFRWQALIGLGLDANERMRLWRAANPLRAKHYSLKANYGISIEEYTQLYEEQGGQCAICDERGASFDSKNGRTGTLVVDHCHDSKKRRALLCSMCNKALGGFRDSIDILRKAIVYLERHR